MRCFLLNLLSFMLVFSSCKRSLEPAFQPQPRITLQTKLDIDKQPPRLSIQFCNNTAQSVWYQAYAEKGPIYAIQTLSDTGWVYEFRWWCFTGIKLYEFKNGTCFSNEFSVSMNGSATRFEFTFYDASGTELYKRYTEAVRF
ncbi:MAG: hypothetical protein GF313_08795 [Caldithrix sp.]|nr:hypothetical protein [Caldithrix sp.]